MIVTFRNYYSDDKYVVELADWDIVNFSFGPRRMDGWFRQVLSVNGKPLVPASDRKWDIPRLTVEQAINQSLFSRFEKVDPMISILYSQMRDRLYPFPAFYSHNLDHEDAKRKCDTVLKFVEKWDKLRAFV